MFIKTYHPKKSMHPNLETIQKILKAGWIAQAKMDGYRSQIHITETGIMNYTRQGQLHTRQIPIEIVDRLRELFSCGMAVIGEWVAYEKKLYLFDCIKKDNQVLDKLTYAERYALLPQGIEDGAVDTLPIIDHEKQAFEVLMDPQTEGLVFKNPDRKGFDSNAIIRCRRCGVNFKPQRRNL